MDFAVPGDHKVQLKSEKKNNYLALTRELKRLSNMKVTVIPIVIGALSTVTERLALGLEDLEIWGQEETIQTTALLRLAKILRRFLETWGDLLLLKFQWETTANAGVKNSQRIKIMIIMIIDILKWLNNITEKRQRKCRNTSDTCNPNLPSPSVAAKHAV